MTNDTEYTDEPICPYCGKAQSDAWEFDDGGEYFCDFCDKTFVVEIHSLHNAEIGAKG